MAEPTDEQLMSQFCQGDERAFEVLFSRHAPDIQAFLGRMMGSPSAGEDALQATFLSVVRSRDRFDATARFKPWLFSIAANAARDLLRRNKRTRLGLESLGDEPEGYEPPQPDPGLAKRLEQALDQLNPSFREAVVLHHVMGWTFEEVSAALGISPGAARIRAHRGYEQLRPLVEHLRENG
jgi:RNA polymerase sigma-70 factor (ECF subfamily)